MLNHLCKDFQSLLGYVFTIGLAANQTLVLSLPVGLTAAIVLEEKRAQATGHQLFFPVSKESLGSNDYSPPLHVNNTCSHSFVLGQPLGPFKASQEHKDQTIRNDRGTWPHLIRPLPNMPARNAEHCMVCSKCEMASGMFMCKSFS